MRGRAKEEALGENQEPKVDAAIEKTETHVEQPVKNAGDRLLTLIKKVNDKRRVGRKPFAYLLHSVGGKHVLFRCPWHLMPIITPQWVDEHKGPPTASEIMNGTAEQVAAYLETAYESD